VSGLSGLLPKPGGQMEYSSGISELCSEEPLLEWLVGQLNLPDHQFRTRPLDLNYLRLRRISYVKFYYFAQTVTQVIILQHLIATNCFKKITLFKMKWRLK